jgi:hypothetical protein
VKPVFDSIPQLLSEAGLGSILGATPTQVLRTPFNVPHYSGSLLEKITCRCDGRTASYVLKRLVPEADWIMRLTSDTLVREIALYLCGIYASLPDQLWHPIVAAAHDGQSWAILMEDITVWLALPAMLTSGQRNQLIRHLAVLHRHFWNGPQLEEPGLGLSSLIDFVSILSPATIARDSINGHQTPVLQLAAYGWHVFERIADRELFGLITGLQNDPTSLLEALGAMPATLVHGDFKLANIGIQAANPEARTIVLDWQDATRGPAFLDLAYWLAVNPGLFPGQEKDIAIDQYRNSLAELGIVYTDKDWARETALCLLAGGGLRLFWQLALRVEREEAGSVEDLHWWEEKVRPAARWLS